MQLISFHKKKNHIFYLYLFLFLGVRITTDVFFDSDSKIPESWVIKRIETDIPQSRIINEFQRKNVSKN